MSKPSLALPGTPQGKINNPESLLCVNGLFKLLMQINQLRNYAN